MHKRTVPVCPTVTMKRVFLFVAIALALVLLITYCEKSCLPVPSIILPSNAHVTCTPWSTEAAESSYPASVSYTIDTAPSMTPEMLNLNSIDTALFYGALTQDLPYRSGKGVTLPFVGVYTQYEEDGLTYVVCHVRYMRYVYNSAFTILLTKGTTETDALAVLSVEEDGSYACESFTLARDDSLFYPDLVDFCGPLVDLPDKIISGEAQFISSFPESKEMRYIFTQTTGITFQ